MIRLKAFAYFISLSSVLLLSLALQEWAINISKIDPPKVCQTPKCSGVFLLPPDHLHVAAFQPVCVNFPVVLL